MENSVNWSASKQGLERHAITQVPFHAPLHIKSKIEIIGVIK